MDTQTTSFGELVELVREAFPDIQDYDQARSYLAGAFYAVISEENIARVADSLRRYTGVREDNGLETQMANVVSLSPKIIEAMKKTIGQGESNA
jgi:hypothetical protein